MNSKLRFFAITGIGALALAAMLLGAYCQLWVVGGGGFVAGLCLLAFAAPLGKRVHRKMVEQPSVDLPVTSTVDTATPLLATSRNLVDELIVQGRCALLLRDQIASNLTSEQRERAHEFLDAAMAVVPAGPVVMRSCRAEDVAEVDRYKVEKRIEVDGFYIDRCSVTNREYQKFVDAGGYEQLPLWDEAVWPAMLQFVDRTGQSGPRFWENGRYTTGKEDHPVVGVSWYEASAYARWAGKRLASDAEWVKASAWPVSTESVRLVQRKFPWGDAMDRGLANLWGSGPGDTVPVTRHAEGASVGGVRQLVGNVWEWTSTNFGAWEPAAQRLESDLPLKSLRGGAFDTYFESQAQCQFQSGDVPLARKHNIGFRCAIGFCDVSAQEQDEESGGDDEVNQAGSEEHRESEEVLT